MTYCHAYGTTHTTWGSLDDLVMVVVTASRAKTEDGNLLFVGTSLTENSSGLASVRTANFPHSINMENYDGVQIRVRGDVQGYK